MKTEEYRKKIRKKLEEAYGGKNPIWVESIHEWFSNHPKTLGVSLVSGGAKYGDFEIEFAKYELSNTWEISGTIMMEEESGDKLRLKLRYNFDKPDLAADVLDVESPGLIEYPKLLDLPHDPHGKRMDELRRAIGTYLFDELTDYLP